MAHPRLRKIGLKEWATERKRMRVSYSGRGRRGTDRAQSVYDDPYSSGCEDQCRGARSPDGAALCCVRIARVPIQNAASDNGRRRKSRYGSHNIKRIDHVGRDLRLVCPRGDKGSLDRTDDCCPQKPSGQAETFTVSEYFTPGFLGQRASSASRRSAKQHKPHRSRPPVSSRRALGFCQLVDPPQTGTGKQISGHGRFLPSRCR